MKKFLYSLLILISASLPAAAQLAIEGLITSIRGSEARLSVGVTDGVKRGDRFEVLKDGRVVAHLQITEVFNDRSTGRLIEPNAAELVRVGDLVRVAGATAPTAPPTVVTVPPLPPPTVTTRMPAAPSEVSVPSAVVIAIRDYTLTLSGGSDDGWQAGMLVSIGINGIEVGRARLTRVEQKTSEARIISLSTGQPLQVGLEAVLIREKGQVGTPEPIVVPKATLRTRTPALHSVPPTDRAYSLLSRLAANGLIKSMPARVFEQNTVFRRRPGDDLVLSRAKVAELIEEAASNGARGNDMSSSDAHAMQLLVQDFEIELGGLGIDVAGLRKQLQARTEAAPVGVGGMVQLRGVRKGQAGPDPISEPAPVREGIAGEARLNIFGSVGSRFSYSGQFEGSSLPLRQNATVRNATVNYRMGTLNLEAGRREFWFGPGQFGTMLLSDGPGNFDFLATRIRRGDFYFEGFSTVIGRDPLRTLHVHRGEFNASPYFKVGASESVLRFDDKISPKHFIGANLPLPLLVITGGGFGNNRLNNMFNFYAEGTSPKGLRLYAEYMIDDLVVKAGDSQNHRLGYLMGAQIFNPRMPHKFNTRLEFASLQPRAYLAFFPGGGTFESFFRNGQPLGYFLTTQDDRGQGLNALRFDMNWMPIQRLTIGGGWELLDQGTAGPNLMRQSNIRIRAIYDITRDLSIALRGMQSTTTNPNFGLGGLILDRNRLEVELQKIF